MRKFNMLPVCEQSHRALLAKWNRRRLLLLALFLVMPAIPACERSQPQEARAASTARDARLTPAAKPAKRKILLVHSYHTGYAWVDAITRGVRRTLSGANADLEIFYMDSKRRTSEDWKQESGAAARKIVSEWQPDVVIAADDNAQRYFASTYAGASTPQIVFCGVNAKPEVYGYPASNITGVLERPHFEDSLALLRRIRPGVRRIAIVSDDSPTSVGALAFMTNRSTDFEIVSREMPSTFMEWQHAISQCQETADAIAIYTYHTIKESAGAESMEPTAVMDWTVDHSRIPIVGFIVFTIDDGGLCGFLESGVEHGQEAGRLALEILGGKTAEDLPMITALAGRSMLNLESARRLGIDVPDDVVRSVDVVRGQ